MDYYLQLAVIGIIFGIIGYLIGKYSTISSSGNSDEKWKIALDTCKQKNDTLQVEIDKLKISTTAKASHFVGDASKDNLKTPYDAKTVKSIFGKSYQQDDLKIVEGIGPKIEELFKTSGILTWKALGETSVDRLREILSKAGDRFQMHDPGTWPKQSKLAHEGKWQELKDWQTTLDGGREV